MVESSKTWFTRHASLFLGIAIGTLTSVSSLSLVLWRLKISHAKRLAHANRVLPPRPVELRSDDVVDGVCGLIGNTPMLRISSLSDALGVDILGKAEFLNPGGSVKDRVALRIIDDAESSGQLVPDTGSMIFEGTVGSTGISIATIASARGYKTSQSMPVVHEAIIMPDDVASEKVHVLQGLGANVELVRPAGIVDKKQFVNSAKQRALEYGQTKHRDVALISVEEETILHPPATTMTTSPVIPPNNNSMNNFATHLALATEDQAKKSARGFFADQFENLSNFTAHLDTTGPEIFRQVNGQMDAFVSGAGTGGTISGISTYLKSQDPSIQVALSDPEGSGLYNRVLYGTLFADQESEGKKRRHQVDTIVEGVGINRITRNFAAGEALINTAIKVTDEEAIAMSRYLVKNDGLFLGSSSAVNLVACVKLAKQLRDSRSSLQGLSQSKIRIVTILCDSGSRHHSKFWNEDYLKEHNYKVDLTLIDELLKVS